MGSASGTIARSASQGALRGVLALSASVLVLVGIGPRTGLYQTMTVLSDSMRPYASAGDMLVVTREPAADVRVGQVIAFPIPVGDHRIVSHRVVSVVVPGPAPVVQTKGDANASPDPWQLQLGGDVTRVRAEVPWLGRVLVWLRQPLAHALLVLGLPVLLALAKLLEIWRPTRRETAPAP